MLTSETDGTAWAATVGAPVRTALTLASIAARNLGIDTRPARYAISAAPTSGSSRSGTGVIAAAAVPPNKSRRFHRKRNASSR
jgi:hypothetical protein